jgi:hypothetical protein
MRRGENMRKHLAVGVVVIGALVAAHGARAGADEGKDPKADAVMAEARKALGGEKLDASRTCRWARAAAHS